MRSLVIEDEPRIGRYISRLLGQLHGIVGVVGSIADAKQAQARRTLTELSEGSLWLVALFAILVGRTCVFRVWGMLAPVSLVLSACTLTHQAHKGLVSGHT